MCFMAPLIIWLCNYLLLCGFDTVSGDFCTFGGTFLALPLLNRTQQVEMLFPIRLISTVKISECDGSFPFVLLSVGSKIVILKGFVGRKHINLQGGPKATQDTEFLVFVIFRILFHCT